MKNPFLETTIKNLKKAIRNHIDFIESCDPSNVGIGFWGIYGHFNNELEKTEREQEYGNLWVFSYDKDGNFCVNFEYGKTWSYEPLHEHSEIRISLWYFKDKEIEIEIRWDEEYYSKKHGKIFKTRKRTIHKKKLDIAKSA